MKKKEKKLLDEFDLNTSNESLINDDLKLKAIKWYKSLSTEELLFLEIFCIDSENRNYQKKLSENI